ncbi:hypothetical protein JAAARDRAFT_72067 [Jaapia argillacea MUCL 33604]|uniref:Berberine/berberine-like domain-containing protein n=1 Tax=Jaapia argillacea MUCL 33604 TaxID=933084 RepID=A0A067PSW0_9AGAM|nr:hypothetical protein JAAARDRAFT_72067 [Jaapia argillacea MUCL 33604]
MADSSILMADSTTNSHLFWGVRGGGCNFGVVTEFVLKLHPQRRNVFGGVCLFDLSVLDRLVDVTLEWWKRGPSKKEGMAQVFGRGPDGKPMIKVLLFYNGSEEEGRSVYKEFFDLHPVVDMCREMPFEEMNTLQNNVAVHGRNVYWKGASHTGGNPDLCKVLFDQVIERSSDPSFTVGLLTEYLGQLHSRRCYCLPSRCPKQHAHQRRLGE